MIYNKKTAQYGEAVFNAGDVMRINDTSAFADCIIVGFGILHSATDTVYAKLARPYCYVHPYSDNALTGVEYIEVVTLSSLATNYKRMSTGRAI
jgi:hypothetical protein